MEKTNIQKLDNKELEKLLIQMKKQDDNSFHKLYELTKSAIYGYSLSILKNHEEALDNMQDVFVKIYEKVDSYKPREKAMNWIFTITKNEALMKLRKQTKIHKEEINQNLLTSSNINEEDKIIIKVLMESLTDVERQIIIMHLIGNLKHKEIAKILDLNLSTTLSKYHRSLKKLRLEWKEV